MLRKVCLVEEMKITLILQLWSQWVPEFEKDKCVWVGNAEPAAAAVQGGLRSVCPRGTASSVILRAVPPSTFAHCTHGANFLWLPSTRGSGFQIQECIHTFHTGTTWNKLFPHMDSRQVWFGSLTKCMLCALFTSIG